MNEASKNIKVLKTGFCCITFLSICHAWRSEDWVFVEVLSLLPPCRSHGYNSERLGSKRLNCHPCSRHIETDFKYFTSMGGTRRSSNSLEKQRNNGDWGGFEISRGNGLPLIRTRLSCNSLGPPHTWSQVLCLPPPPHTHTYPCPPSPPTRSYVFPEGFIYTLPEPRFHTKMLLFQ